MDWKIIIRHYKSNHRPRKDNEHDWFRRQSSIESAIIIATEAKDERGKPLIMITGTVNHRR